MQEYPINQNFSNIQMELLKLYSTDVQERELHDIKEFLAHYVAQKAIEKRLNEAKEGIAKGNYLQESN